MPHYAVKRLTASDLSFFTAHYSPDKTHQKGINLNADVFVEQFYPALQGRFEEVPLRLTVFAPGGLVSETLRRKALRPRGGKNWRLNGELVANPPEDAHRYDRLAVGDYAIMVFDGEQRPEDATLILVSADVDPSLHAILAQRLPAHERVSMAAVDESFLQDCRAAVESEYPERHPLLKILQPDAPEQVILGTAEEQERTAQRDGRGPSFDPETLRRQLRACEETGEIGEEVFDSWLKSQGLGEEDFEWVSRTHPRAAFDFQLPTLPWNPSLTGPFFIDVKATKDASSSRVCMSLSEIRWAALHPTYRIARVYSVRTTSPRIGILSGIHEICQQIIVSLAQLPEPVQATSFEIDASALDIERETQYWQGEATDQSEPQST